MDDKNEFEDVEKLKPYISALDRNPPTAKHLRISKSLKKYIDDAQPLETPEERKIRERIVVTLSTMVNDWVVESCRRKGVNEEEAKLGGKLYISGSYRLGVNTKSSDIDTICCVPWHIDRSDFFSETAEGFLYRLRRVPEITHVLPISEAMVPIIEVVWNGIELDVLFARVERAAVPDLTQILDDAILKGLDQRTVIALNGPRVTELIIKLVPNYATFSTVLRVVRLWAKSRGIYSNKLGFLGGVNFNILVAFACQLYPTAAAAKLLSVFFGLYSEWKWPTEIRLCHPYDVDYLDLKQWDPAIDLSEKYHVMPIITPAYPCSNSSFNVSWPTLDIMLGEFTRAKEICNQIFKKSKSETLDKSVWAPLFQRSDFFLRFGTFIAVDLSTDEAEDFPAWSGFSSSRLRKLVDALQRLPFRKIYPFPRSFDEVQTPQDQPQTEITEKDKTEQEESKEASEDDEDTTPPTTSTRYYIGILRHPVRAASRKRLDMSREIQYWKSSLQMWNGYKPSMHVSVRLLKWTQLPDDERLFPEGKEAAKGLRMMWAQRIKLEQDEIKNSKQNNLANPHRVWSVDEDKIDLAKAAEAALTTNIPEGTAEEKEAENTIANTTEGATVAQQDETQKQPDTRQAQDSPAVKLEAEDAVVEEEEEEEDLQKLLDKRIREEQSMREMNKRLRIVNTFQELPRVGGIDIQKSLPSQLST